MKIMCSRSLSSSVPKFEKRLGRVMDSQDITADGLYAVALGESALHNFVADGLVARCRAHEPGGGLWHGGCLCH